MTLGQNPFNPSRSLPTLAAINHRRRELLAYQASQEAARRTTAPGEPLAEGQPHLPEESRPFQQQEEEQEEPQELQHSYPDDSYPVEDPEPSLPLPPRSPAPSPPALA